MDTNHKSFTLRVGFGVIVAALLMGLSCAKAPVDTRVPPWVPLAAPGDDVVARVGDVPIFASDVRAKMSASGAGRQEALDAARKLREGS